MNGTGTVIGLGLLFLAANTAPANAQGGNAPRVADAKPGDVRVMVTAAIRTPRPLYPKGPRSSINAG